jgi:S-adenosylmethionine:tRNA ribosyltransferase-isomerase
MSALLQGDSPLRFEIPAELEAGEPAEVRWFDRDDVRLMVAFRGDGRLVHSWFSRLPEFLRAGDLLVINTSGTLPASLPASTPEGLWLAVHLSSWLPDGRWALELRRPHGAASLPLLGATVGQRILLPTGGTLRLIGPFDGLATAAASPTGGHRGGTRLWLGEVALPEDLFSYLARHGRPIRYPHVRRPWPLASYQTVYAREPGSAEMPSAGRAFTERMITRLVAEGVLVAPLVLHTGVSSPEEGEAPYPEFYRVPDSTASLVNAVRAWRGRVIAVGTTVVRALESVSDRHGKVRGDEGWTNLVVTPERGVRVVDGLLTGWHSGLTSHLRLLEAVGGRPLVEASYRAALQERYLWHEFGDLHLILP